LPFLPGFFCCFIIQGAHGNSVESDAGAVASSRLFSKSIGQWYVHVVWGSGQNQLVSQTQAIIVFAPLNWCHRHRPYMSWRHPVGVTNTGHMCVTQMVSQTNATFVPHSWCHRHRQCLRHPTGVTDTGHTCICATQVVSQTRPHLCKTASVTDTGHIRVTKLGLVLQKNRHCT